MRDWEAKGWKREWTFTKAPFAVFIHTPLCGTCKAARRMLAVATEIVTDFPIMAANLNLMPDIAGQFQIESVPCLLFKRKDGTWHKQYRFPSVTDLVERLRIESEHK